MLFGVLDFVVIKDYLKGVEGVWCSVVQVMQDDDVLRFYNVFL